MSKYQSFRYWLQLEDGCLRIAEIVLSISHAATTLQPARNRNVYFGSPRRYISCIVSIHAVIKCNANSTETIQTGQLRQRRGIIAGR